jgi:hypothetical protein
MGVVAKRQIPALSELYIWAHTFAPISTLGISNNADSTITRLENVYSII